jgi:hypothetical protein
MDLAIFLEPRLIGFGDACRYRRGGEARLDFWSELSKASTKEPGVMADAIEDKIKIREVLAKYCTFGDNNRFGELAALFTPDGQWQGRMGSAKGRGEIEALMARMNPPAGQGPVRRHLVTNIVITVNGNSADVQSTFMMVRDSENGPMIGAVGSYTDTLTKVGDDWLIASRKVTPDIIGEARLKS